MTSLLLDANLVVQIDQTQNQLSPSGTSPASSCPILAISDDEEGKAAVSSEYLPSAVPEGTHTQETFQVYLRWRRALKQAARLGKGLAGRDKQYRRFRSTDFPRSLSDVCCSPTSAGASPKSSLASSPLSNHPALPQGCQALLLRTEHWLEVADTRHRYGSNLRPYLDYWLALDPSRPDSCSAEKSSPRNPANPSAQLRHFKGFTGCQQQQITTSANVKNVSVDVDMNGHFLASVLIPQQVQQFCSMQGNPGMLQSSKNDIDGSALQPGIVTDMPFQAPHILATADSKPPHHRLQQSCIELPSVQRTCNSFTQFESKPSTPINLDLSRDNFFRWLDHGDGRHVDLGLSGGPSRLKLETEIVEYLTEDQLTQYEVVVDPATGQLVYCLSGRAVDTRWRPQLPDQDINETTCHDPPPWETLQQNDAETPLGCGTQYEAEGVEAVQGAIKAEDNLSKASKWIYVVDTDGCLYVHPKVRGRFHHSSFLRGGAVLAAGAMIVHHGRLRAMTADSGHYWPQPDHFKWFYQHLQAQGADLSALEGMTFRTKH